MRFHHATAHGWLITLSLLYIWIFLSNFKFLLFFFLQVGFEFYCSNLNPRGWYFVNPKFHLPHLSKRKSDLQQKCTPFLTPFSRMVFHGRSSGVIHFFGVLALKTTLIEASDWLFKEFPSVRKWFLGLTLQTKRIKPCERA